KSIPGTPAAGNGDLRKYVLGLADMYVADPRFAANYGGEQGARFVQAALHAYVDSSL
ncbi:MAG TPA: TipAS antibiotic-recognition domain-containing protein, partial [Arthrobacter sp.]